MAAFWASANLTYLRPKGQKADPMVAPLPDDETERLAALYEQKILDTPHAEEFDDLVRLAAHICNVPIAAISLVDEHRQWFKSITGLDVPETPRDVAFCAHTILQQDIMIVSDAKCDPRFADNPLVTGAPSIRFYAGVPLITESGYALGSLCVIDNIPRILTSDQEKTLKLLARQVDSHINASRRVAERERLLADHERLVMEKEHLADERTRTETERLRLATIVETCADAIYSVTLDRQITSWNRGAEHLYGYTAAEAIGQSVNILIPSDHLPEMDNIMATVKRDHEVEPVSTVRRTKDGKLVDVSLRVSAALDTEGRMIGASMIARDITDWKRAEETLVQTNAALAEGEERLGLATKSAQIGIWDWDVTANKMLWDDQMHRLYGIDEKDFTGAYDTWQRGLHPEDRARAESEIVIALQGARDFHTQFRVIWPNKEVHSIEAHAVVQRSGDGVPVRMIGVNWDVTEREQAKEALSQAHDALGESEERFRGSVNAMEEGLALQDKDGTILFCNESAERVLGLSADQMMGRTSLDPRWRAVRDNGEDFPGDQHPSMVALSTGIAQRNIVMGVHKPNGELTWISINAVPLQHAGEKNPNGVVVTFADITEQRRAELLLKEDAILLEFQKQELERANAELEALATTDGLTGLKNHRAFQTRLGEEVSRARRYDTPLALIMLDVDRFKQYNDTYGHPAGDVVLKAIAGILQDCARDTDRVARYGGEEFILILPQTDLEGAMAVAERMQAAVERHEWPMRSVTASFGVATLRPGDTAQVEIIARADAALYLSKASGRNRVTCAA